MFTAWCAKAGFNGERTRAALGAAKARGAVLGGDRGYRPSVGPCAAAAALARGEAATRAAHRLSLEIGTLQQEGVTTLVGLAPVSDRARGAGTSGWRGLDPHDRGSGALQGR